MRSAGKVVDEMELYVREYGARQIIIFDETFAADGPRALDICNRILARRLSFRWEIHARADTLDRTLLAAMKEAGCRRVHLRVASGSPRVLQALAERIRVDDFQSAVSAAVDLGIETHGHFMLGRREDDPESIRETIRLSRRLGLDRATFAVATDVDDGRRFLRLKKLAILAFHLRLRLLVVRLLRRLRSRGTGVPPRR